MGQIYEITNQNVYFSYHREHSTCFLDLIEIFSFCQCCMVSAVSMLVSDPPLIFYTGFARFTRMTLRASENTEIRVFAEKSHPCTSKSNGHCICSIERTMTLNQTRYMAINMFNSCCNFLKISY